MSGEALRTATTSGVITTKRLPGATDSCAESAMPLKADLDAIDWEDPARAAAGRPHHQCRAVQPGSASRRRPASGESSDAGTRHHPRLPSAAQRAGARTRRGRLRLIGLHHQSESELKAFADRTRNWPIVRAAWTVSRRIRLHAALRGERPRYLPELRHRRTHLRPQRRYSPHRADHPAGQGRGADRDLGATAATETG